MGLLNTYLDLADLLTHSDLEREFSIAQSFESHCNLRRFAANAWVVLWVKVIF